MSSLSPNEVTLISEDGIKFQVRVQVVRCIGLFKNLLELQSAMGNSAGPMPPLQVPNVNSLILDKIIEYLNNYTASKENSALTRGGKAADLRVKNIISGIQAGGVSSVSKNSKRMDDDDDGDDNYGDDDDDSVTGIINGAEIVSEVMRYDGDEYDFEIPSDDENVFDFANFDEQSLKLFTPYEQNFFGSLDIPTLIEVTKAANFMHIPHLLDSCCKAIANHMKGLTVEELRTKFNIRNDFTPEEEERVRRETAWIDE